MTESESEDNTETANDGISPEDDALGPFMEIMAWREGDTASTTMPGAPAAFVASSM